MPFTTHNGDRIHYEVYHEGDGPPVVYLHSFLSGVDIHEATNASPTIASFTGRHELILIDTLGHGQSDKPDDASHYNRASRSGQVVAVLDAMGHERAHIFGYSLGGWLACSIAKHAPGRLLSLVVGGWDAEESMGAYRDANGITDGLMMRPDASIEGVRKATPDAVGGPDHIKALNHCWDAMWEVEGARADIERLINANIPVLFYCGIEDLYVHNSRTLSNDLGFALIEAEGDHVGAMRNINVHLDDILDFFGRAQLQDL